MCNGIYFGSAVPDVRCAKAHYFARALPDVRCAKAYVVGIVPDVRFVIKLPSGLKSVVRVQCICNKKLFIIHLNM